MWQKMFTWTRYRYQRCSKESSCVQTQKEVSTPSAQPEGRRGSCTWNCSQGSLNSFFTEPSHGACRPYRCIAAEMSSKSPVARSQRLKPLCDLLRLSITVWPWGRRDISPLTQTIRLYFCRRRLEPLGVGWGGRGVHVESLEEDVSCHPFSYLTRDTGSWRSCWCWRLRLLRLSGLWNDLQRRTENKVQGRNRECFCLTDKLTTCSQNTLSDSFSADHIQSFTISCGINWYNLLF